MSRPVGPTSNSCRTPVPRRDRWLTVALAISAVVGSTERALRLRYNRWLDPVAS